MKVGVPTEIKEDEYRVAITPAGVREMVEHGHEVLIQAGAGEGSAIADADYEEQGARTVADAAVALRRGRDDPPGQGAAAGRDRDAAPGQLLFTYLHLAPDPEQTRGLHELGRDLRRLRDGRGRPAAACRCWRR